MPDWKAIAIIAAVPAVVGPVLDRLLMNRHKLWLHDWLLTKWCGISETRIPELHRQLAIAWVSKLHLYLGKRIFSRRSCIVSAVISITWTSLLCVGAWWVIPPEPPPAMLRIMRPDMIFNPDGALLRGLVGALPILLFVNVGCDVVTIQCTCYFLTKIARSRRWFVGLTAAVGDIGVAYLLCVVVVFAVFPSQWMLQEVVEPGWQWDDQDLLSLFLTPAMAVGRLLSWPPRQGYTVFGLFILTAFIPTASIMVAYLFLILCRFLVAIYRIVAMYFLERATEVEDSTKLVVFTLTGSLFSVIVVIGKAIHYLISG